MRMMRDAKERVRVRAWRLIWLCHMCLRTLTMMYGKHAAANRYEAYK